MTSVAVQETSPPPLFARVKRFAPFLLLGPISGPLAARGAHHFSEGRPVLGSLYAIAILEIALVLPYVVAVLGIRVL